MIRNKDNNALASQKYFKIFSVRKSVCLSHLPRTYIRDESQYNLKSEDNMSSH